MFECRRNLKNKNRVLKCLILHLLFDAQSTEGERELRNNYILVLISSKNYSRGFHFYLIFIQNIVVNITLCKNIVFEIAGW